MALFIGPLIVHPGLMHLNGPVARLNLAGRMMAVADHQAMALIVQVMAVALDVLIDFPFDGCLKSPASAVAKNVVDDRHGCQMKLKCVRVHEAYPFCPVWDDGEPFETIHRRYAAFIQPPTIHDFRL